jgi:hypothetical protein
MARCDCKLNTLCCPTKHVMFAFTPRCVFNLLVLFYIRLLQVSEKTSNFVVEKELIQLNYE